MWYLTSENDKRVLYILPEKNVLIGRYLDAQNCNFAISEDASISRKHATLIVTDNSLFLKDLGSKYGTFINDSDKIEHNEMIKLNNDDVVKFGKLGCVWKVQHRNFVTCTSTLKGENLQILKNLLGTLGGTLKNEWDDTCAYLTMPAITLTIKVVLALVQNSRIVTTDYWKMCVEAVGSNIPLPNPDNFIPQVLESTLNKENLSFCPNGDRNILFTGKKVIFFSRKQLEMYKTVLMKSSATPLLLSDSKLTKSALCEDDVIVIQPNQVTASQDTQVQRDQINEIIDYLKNKGRRVVADAEIGLAILYCSTVKYCNPVFNLPTEVVKQVPNPNNNPRNVLAQESQATETLSKNENILIDESMTQKHSLSNENSNSLKRKLSENDISCTNKKLATDTSLNTTSNKRQGEFIDMENPPKKIAFGNDEDNMFNFAKSGGTTIAKQNDSKRLNLSKPLKRKLSTDNEDDLFNFIDNKKVAIDKPGMLLPKNTEELTTSKINSTQYIDEKLDLNALRGSKLVELIKSNLNMVYNNIKKEDTTELDEKFSDITLESASIIVRNDLVIKKEPIKIQVHECGIKNVKKFKKVWQMKQEVTIPVS